MLKSFLTWLMVTLETTVFRRGEAEFELQTANGASPDLIPFPEDEPMQAPPTVNTAFVSEKRAEPAAASSVLPQFEVRESEAFLESIEQRIGEQEQELLKTEEEFQKILAELSPRDTIEEPPPSEKKHRSRKSRTCEVHRTIKDELFHLPAEKSSLLELPAPEGSPSGDSENLSLVQRDHQETEIFLQKAKQILDTKPVGKASPSYLEEVKSLVTPLCRVAQTETLNEHLRFAAIVLLGRTGAKRGFQVIKRLMYHPNSALRCASAGSLVNFRNPNIVPLLLESLNDANRFVRSTSVSALGQLTKEAALPALVERLGDSSGLVQKSAREALKRFPKPILLKQLPELMEKNNERVFEKGLPLLIKLRKGDSKSVLLEFLNSKEDRIRRQAINYAINLGDPSLIPSVMESMRQSERDLMLQAEKGLEKNKKSSTWFYSEMHGKIKEMQLLAPETAREKLLNLYESQDHLVRGVIVSSLEEIKTPVIFQDLTNIIRREEHPTVKMRAVSALSQFGLQAEPQLIEILSTSKDDELVLTALRELAKVGGQNAAARITDFAKSPNAHVKFFAERALDEIQKRFYTPPAGAVGKQG